MDWKRLRNAQLTVIARPSSCRGSAAVRWARTRIAGSTLGSCRLAEEAGPGGCPTAESSPETGDAAHWAWCDAALGRPLRPAGLSAAEHRRGGEMDEDAH